MPLSSGSTARVASFSCDVSDPVQEKHGPMMNSANIIAVVLAVGVAVPGAMKVAAVRPMRDLAAEVNYSGCGEHGEGGCRPVCYCRGRPFSKKSMTSNSSSGASGDAPKIANPASTSAPKNARISKVSSSRPSRCDSA